MSQRPIPKSKFEEIISELNMFVSSGEVDEVKLMRFKHEAEKLRKADPMRGFTILGMIACVKDDLENTRLYHKNAIAFAKGLTYPKFQYAVSMLNMMEFNEAYDLLLDLYKEDDSDLVVLDHLINVVAVLGKEKDFKKLCDTWHEVTGSEHSRVGLMDDNPVEDRKTLDMLDVMMETRAESVVAPSPELIKSIDELVNGIEV